MPPTSCLDVRTHLICTFDTLYHADSVEWCPIIPYQSLIACGNYQLGEDESQANGANQERLGRVLLLEFIGSATAGASSIQLVQSIDTAAVLDQKWCFNTLNGKPVLAVVYSSGCLELYTLEENAGGANGKPYLKSWLSYTFPAAEKERFLLSVDWSSGKYPSPEPFLAVSDSFGCINYFHVNATGLVLVKSYPIHEHEAWVCAFDYWNPNFIFSGADDSLLVRTNTESSHHARNRTHRAGVTCMHSNKNYEHLLATGSYDECVRVWDTRHLKEPKSTMIMRGPVWRIKWNPLVMNELITACMDGGAAIVCSTDADTTDSFQIVADFNGHRSLVYGSDWCHAQGTRLIATCSFYDHLVCVARVNEN